MTKYKITYLDRHYENFVVGLNGKRYFMSPDKLAEVLKQLPHVEGKLVKKRTRTWFEWLIEMAKSEFIHQRDAGQI